MKILIISPFICDSKTGHGGGALSYKQLLHLSEKHDLAFLSFSDNPDTDIKNKDISQLCDHIMLVKNNGMLVRLLSFVKAIFRLRPPGSIFYFSRTMVHNINTMLYAFKPDVTLVLFPQMAQYVKYISGCKAVLDVQDAFSVSKFRFSLSSGSIFKKSINLINWLLWVRYELIYYRQFDKVFTLTEQDRIGLNIFNPDLSVVYCNAAIDTAVDKWSNVSKPVLGFIGSFDHSPNIDAVKYLIEDIFPLVSNVRPDVQLVIAGKGNFPFQRYRNHSNIQFLGYVNNLSDFYLNVSCVVIPLRFGGGVKVKTLEAMSYGVPIIASNIAIEGIKVQHGKHLLVANHADEFCNSILSLLDDTKQKNTLSNNAIEHIEKYYSWGKRISQIESILA